MPILIIHLCLNKKLKGLLLNPLTIPHQHRNLFKFLSSLLLLIFCSFPYGLTPRLSLGCRLARADDL